LQRGRVDLGQPLGPLQSGSDRDRSRAKRPAQRGFASHSRGTAVVDVVPGDDFELITRLRGGVINECASPQITEVIHAPRLRKA
jgi:hypothetical protein